MAVVHYEVTAESLGGQVIHTASAVGHISEDKALNVLVLGLGGWVSSFLAAWGAEALEDVSDEGGEEE